MGKKRKDGFEGSTCICHFIFTLVYRGIQCLTYLIPAGHFATGRSAARGRMVIVRNVLSMSSKRRLGILQPLNMPADGIGEVSRNNRLSLIMGKLSCGQSTDAVKSAWTYCRSRDAGGDNSFSLNGGILQRGRCIWHGGGNASIYRNYGNPGNVHGL